MMRWPVLVVLAAMAASLSSAGAQDGLASRPSDYAACGAWSTHVQELMDQHRLTAEISDEEFDTVLRLFGAARETCSAGRFKDAFHLYSVIPLGRPQRAVLR